ncbi:MAG: DNA polymerase III subunit gamma/tau [Candidatus Nealsonbacteria bacterium]|nr:DNA polymerase III subunit gamma/tau [Candidatus Nealsonbacteria bacterium]
MKEQNLVLYRKYRPENFAEIVGQNHIVRTLSNAISEGMVSHAYLFAGPRGTGKTTIARILAKSVNCSSRQEKEWEPCNKCSSCLEISHGRSIDLIEIDAASHRGIDEMRELRDGIRFLPTKSRYKVFIIDECHQLSKDAANALLKTLEEPPSHAIFILATTEIHKMIPTIISRCQRFDFRKLTSKEIVQKLKTIIQKEKANIEEKALNLIALNSEGSIRDAEGFLDQALIFAGFEKQKEIKMEDIKDLLGLVEINTVAKLVDFIAEKNSRGAIDFLNETLEKGYDPKEFAKTLIEYLRQVLLFKIDSGLQNPLLLSLSEDEKIKFQNQIKNFEEKDILKMLNLFIEAQEKMRYSSIIQLPLELALIEAINSR